MELWSWDNMVRLRAGVGTARILGGFSADWDEGGAGVVWAAGREMAVNSVRVSLPH